MALAVKRSTSLTVKRTLDASPERIYRAFTSGEELSKWYAPAGMTAEVDELDVREGGSFEITMRNDESEYTCYGTFLELVPHRRIVQTWQWRGEEWNEEGTLVTILISPVEEGTELILTHDRFRDGEEANGHAEGWTEALEKLAELLNRSRGVNEK